MDEKEIAKIIVNRRNSLAPVVQQGEMRAALGPDGYADAMRRGWLRPNMDTGELTITDAFSQLADMRKMAEAVEPGFTGAVLTEPNGAQRTLTANPDGSYTDPKTNEVLTTNPDGTLSLSNPADPTKATRYQKTALRKLAPTATAAAPASPVTTTTKPTTSTMGASATGGVPGSVPPRM